MKIHIVQKGDTLWNISKKYGVSFEEVKKMNAQLSNPDMIMPGMKIKVPTTGGSVKKEAPINYGVKEMPKAEHPYKEQKPMTMPAKEMPKKEAPIMKEKPMVQPKAPKMPQPILPDIDINNYYMMNNQANLSVQPKPAPQPQPKPEVKGVQEESSESPLEMPAQQAPTYFDNCVPVTPVMPGSGFGYKPYQHGPMPYAPQVQGAMQGYPMPGMGMPMMDEEDYSYMPQQNMPQVAGVQDEEDYMEMQEQLMNMGQMPAMPQQMQQQPLPGMQAPGGMPMQQPMQGMQQPMQQPMQGMQQPMQGMQQPFLPPAPMGPFGPFDNCYPVSPVMPGPGYGAPYGQPQGPAPGVMGAMDPGFGPMPGLQGPGFGQMPPMVPGAGFGQMPPMMPGSGFGPGQHGMGYGMPGGQVQGAMDQGYDDCGCGPKPEMQPYRQPNVPQGQPYGPQGMPAPFMGPQYYNAPNMYPQASFSMPRYDDEDYEG
ncbi:SafA/ExsA family spore coat assembly protein [Bacillus coahuilensis]|uniref:SafA/ExsA family spore coat assembly protein n=1 Tax=Bacillus coahuilensis TaxID=408580 RepID=UPI00018510AF|nr:SafA/ExsA family spore coat assembly protein [Bacillus coahuilensis]